MDPAGLDILQRKIKILLKIKLTPLRGVYKIFKRKIKIIKRN
jgi:hypothetical protein